MSKAVQKVIPVWPLYALGFGAILVFLIQARQLIAPMLFSLLLALLLLPVARRLEAKRRVSRIGASVLSVLLAFVVILSSIALLSSLLSSFTAEIPELQNVITERMDAVSITVAERFGLQAEAIKTWLRSTVVNQGVTQFAISNTIGAIANASSQLIAVLIGSFFLLAYRDKWRQVLVGAFSAKKRDLIQQGLRAISQMLPRYLLGMISVSALLAVIGASVLSAFQIPGAVFLGLVFGLFNFVPIVGPFAALVLIIALSLLTSTLQSTVIIFFVMLILQFVESNIVTPLITGSQVDLNPLAIIFGLLIANYIWGITGMVLAIPMLASFRIIFGLDKRLAFLVTALDGTVIAKRQKPADPLTKATQKFTDKLREQIEKV